MYNSLLANSCTLPFMFINVRCPYYINLKFKKKYLNQSLILIICHMAIGGTSVYNTGSLLTNVQHTNFYELILNTRYGYA